MNLEEQIWTLLKDAPLQYGNRTQALVGLFGVPENGFIWQDGELVAASHPVPAQRAPTDLIEMVDPHATYDLGPSVQSLHVYSQFSRAFNHARRARHVQGNLEHLARQAPVPRMVPDNFMQGRIRDIPDNIRDDWLLGALEFLLLILRMDPAFTTKSQKNIDQIQAASGLMQALLLRFADRVAFAPGTAANVSTDEMAALADA